MVHGVSKVELNVLRLGFIFEKVVAQGNFISVERSANIGGRINTRNPMNLIYRYFLINRQNGNNRNSKLLISH